MEKDFIQTEELKILLITWNINNFIPATSFFNLKQLFNLENQQTPDIVAVRILK
jgi:hypothetical protein